MFIEGTEEGAGHAEGDGGVGKCTEEKTENGVDAEVHDLVIGQGEKGVDLLDAGGGHGRDAEDEGIEEHAREEVFPWRLFHKKGILGLE